MKKLPNLITVGALALGALLVGGCESTPESRISAHPQVFAQLSPQEQALVREGQVGIGMDMNAVKLALGNPDSVTYRTDAQGQVEIWHYLTTSYWDGTYLYGGPYWGAHGRHRHWVGWGGGWGWGGWYPYGAPVTVYEHFRVVFRNGRVIRFAQENPAG